MTVINASAATTLLEQRPELPKPHENNRLWVSSLCVDVILGPSIAKTEINFVH